MRQSIIAGAPDTVWRHGLAVGMAPIDRHQQRIR